MSKIKGGPIRHKSLPDSLLDSIATIHETIGRYLNCNLEKFELDFMRDAHPDREVAIWSAITLAWVIYHDHYIEGELLPVAEEKKLIGALLSISMGIDDPARLGVPATIGVRLIACYRSFLDPA